MTPIPPPAVCPSTCPLVGAQTAAEGWKETSLGDSGLVKRNLSDECWWQVLAVLGHHQWHPESSVEMQTLRLPASLPVTPVGVSTGGAQDRKGDWGSQTQIHHTMDDTQQHGHITGSANAATTKSHLSANRSFRWMCLEALLLQMLPTVKAVAQCRRPRFNLWVGKISWRRKWQPNPVSLPGKSHGWRGSLEGYSSWGHRVGHDFTFTFTFV